MQKKIGNWYQLTSLKMDNAQNAYSGTIGMHLATYRSIFISDFLSKENPHLTESTAKWTLYCLHHSNAHQVNYNENHNRATHFHPRQKETMEKENHNIKIGPNQTAIQKLVFLSADLYYHNIKVDTIQKVLDWYHGNCPLMKFGLLSKFSLLLCPQTVQGTVSISLQ